MAARSTVVVLGRVEESVEQEKIERLLLTGLVNSLGEEAPALDVGFGQLAIAFPQPASSGEFGLCISKENNIGTNHLIRVQFNPTAEQFRKALREAFAYALNTGRASESDPSVDGRVNVIYAGQVIAHTGEWLLADSAVAGHQVHSWLDSQAAMAWWPQLDKYPNIGDKLHVHLVTPVAGPGSSWALNKPGHPQSILTHVDVRLVQLNLYIEGSWRFGGKPVSNNPANTESYDGIRSFVQQVIHKHPLTELNLVSSDPALGCALSAQRPALYVFPGSGLGSQSCGLFSLQGFTMLLGGAYTAENFPNWWPMVRNLPKLDAVLIPDWSASNLLTHRFMTKLVETGAQGSNIIGEVLVPPSATSLPNNESTSDLALAPPTGTHANMSQSPWAPNNLSSEALPPSMLLYSKLGWGELHLQPLAQRAGLVLLWKSISASHQNYTTPLRIVLPATQLCGASPIQGLIRLLKSMNSVSSLEGKTGGTGKVSTDALKYAKANSAAARPPSLGSRPNGPTQARTGAPPARPQTAPRLTSATTRTTAGATLTAKKPTASPFMNAKRPVSATVTATATSKRPGSGVPTLKTTANGTLSKLSPLNKSASRPTDKPVPAGTKSSLQKPKPPSTADRLTAHANLVASKQTTHKGSATGGEKTKSAAPTKKPVAAAGKPAAAVAAKAKSPILEVSEPKSPAVPHEELQTPIKTSAPAEAPITNDALKESMELAAVDPLMSGWRSMEQSLVVGAPLVGASMQQEELMPEVGTNQERMEMQQEEVASDVTEHPAFVSDADGEPESVIHPQDLYKVHKFERFNEADEADLVDETQTQSSMDQEPDDLVHDHTVPHFERPAVSIPAECTDMFHPAMGSIVSGEQEDAFEHEKHIEKPEEVHSPARDEGMHAISPSSLPMHDHVFTLSDRDEPNGIATARSRPPAHLGLEDEGEQEHEEVVRSSAPKAFSQMPVAIKQLEHSDDAEVAHQDVIYSGEKTNPDYESYEVTAPTPESSGWNQETNDLSDTSSFERHEEDAAAAAAAALSAATGSPFEEISEVVIPTDHRDTMTQQITKSQNSESEEHLSDSLDAHQFPHETHPSTEPQRELDDAYTEDIDAQAMKEVHEGRETALRAETNPQNSFASQLQDISGFVTSELNPASIEFPPENIDEHAFLNVTSSVDHQHELHQFMHEATTDLVQADQGKTEEFGRPLELPAQHDEYQMLPSQRELNKDEEENTDPESRLCQHQPLDQLHPLSQMPESLASPKEPETIPALAAEPSIESQSSFPKPDNYFDENENTRAQLTENELEPVDQDEFGGHSCVSDERASDYHQPGDEVCVADEGFGMKSAVPNEATLPEHEDWSQMLGSQGDVLPVMEGHSALGIDPADNESEKRFSDEDFHLQQEVASGTKGELEECYSQRAECDALHATDVHEAYEISPQEISANPIPSSDVEDEVSTTCQQAWSQPLVDTYHTVPDQLIEDEQSIEAQMRLKLQQEAGTWSPGFRADDSHAQLEVKPEAALRESSDISDVEEGVGTELWVRNNQPLEHHSADSPLLSDALEARSKHFMVAAEDDKRDSIEQHVVTDTAFESSTHYHPEGDVVEFKDSLGMEKHDDVMAGLTDSLEQEAVDDTHFMHKITPVVAADSTTNAMEQAVHSSTQPIDKEPKVDEFEYGQVIDEGAVSHQFTKPDGTDESMSITADSTTMDNAEQEEPAVFTAQVPLGFDQLLHANEDSNEGVDQPDGIASPESHASVVSVVDHQPQVHGMQDVDGQDLPHNVVHREDKQIDGEQQSAMYCHQQHEEEGFYHPVDISADDHTSDHPIHEESSDVRITSTEQHIPDELSNGEIEPAECEHPEDMLPTSATVGTTEIGFIGYDRQISENGHAAIPSFDETHLIGSQEDRPTNGIHSSGLPDSHNLASPGMGEYSNGTAHHFRPYPPYQDEGAEEDEELHSSSHLKMIQAEWTHGPEGHSDVTWSPTAEAWSYKAGMHPDQFTPEQTDADQRDVPYPIHGAEFPNYPASKNPFETVTTTAAATTDESTHPSGASTDHQADISGRSPLISPQTDGFDPLQSWGQPQGLPTPTLPATAPRGGRTANPPVRSAPMRTAPTSAASTRGKSTSAVSGPTAPATLPPGSPVYMDLIWVPGYLIQVPQLMAVEFFARVRARTYVLSGDALHPMIGEALIEGKSKWGPNDVELLRRQAGTNEEDNAICILPTDEPYEWGCWLRTPCGRINRDTGEARLQTAGFKVLPSASCCDIEFSAGSVNVRCEGVRVEF
ncbi:hypothetical protein D915_005398 [Fasciola hepatica]|uniref:Microtubule-associated protein futsch n=1 Tax=Fasciola hepatica TaxID=6192 RepID=A0A4E0RBZ6_FASHE|nr:hypothetical protein D915_005398 [Fasciola hepatica]